MLAVTILTLPNLITLLRIGAIPLFLILLTDGRYSEALGVFIVAGVTDSLDGAIARLTHSHTTLGAYIDPLADKLLLVSAFVILAFLGVVPRWLTILVISRDVIIMVGFAVLFFMTGRSIAVRPSLLGKACTFLQLLTVSLTLGSLHNPAWQFPFLWHSAVALAGGATVLSGLQYLLRALVWLNQQGTEQFLGSGPRQNSAAHHRHYSA